MASVKLKVVRMGRSSGVRIPARLLRRYEIGDAIVMEERSEGILLRRIRPAIEQLSWQETARQMAASDEDWSDWDAATADGLEDLL
jgi:antitoxin component of MazEF toxin-antitoxin module